MSTVLGKRELLEWAQETAAVPCCKYNDLRDGLVLLLLAYTIFPPGEAAQRAARRQRHGPREAQQNWRLLLQLLARQQVPAALVHADAIRRGGSARHCYNVLVLLYFLHKLTICRHFSLQLASPVTPALAQFLESKRSLAALQQAGEEEGEAALAPTPAERRSRSNSSSGARLSPPTAATAAAAAAAAIPRRSPSPPTTAGTRSPDRGASGSPPASGSGSHALALENALLREELQHVRASAQLALTHQRAAAAAELHLAREQHLAAAARAELDHAHALRQQLVAPAAPAAAVRLLEAALAAQEEAMAAQQAAHATALRQLRQVHQQAQEVAALPLGGSGGGGGYEPAVVASLLVPLEGLSPEAAAPFEASVFTLCTTIETLRATNARLAHDLRARQGPPAADSSGSALTPPPPYTPPRQERSMLFPYEPQPQQRQQQQHHEEEEEETTITSSPLPSQPPPLQQQPQPQKEPERRSEQAADLETRYHALLSKTAQSHTNNTTSMSSGSGATNRSSNRAYWDLYQHPPPMASALGRSQLTPPQWQQQQRREAEGEGERYPTKGPSATFLLSSEELERRKNAILAKYGVLS